MFMSPPHITANLHISVDIYYILVKIYIFRLKLLEFTSSSNGQVPKSIFSARNRHQVSDDIGASRLPAFTKQAKKIEFAADILVKLVHNSRR